MTTTFAALLEALGVSLKLFFASVAGAFISLNFFEKRIDESKRQTFARRWSIVLCGTFLGMFSTGLVMTIFEVRPENYAKVEVGAGVLVSLFGMAVIAEAYNAVKQVKWSEHLDALARRITGKGGS